MREGVSSRLNATCHHSGGEPSVGTGPSNQQQPSGSRQRVPSPSDARYGADTAPSSDRSNPPTPSQASSQHWCRPQTVGTWSTSALVYPFKFVAVHWRRPQGKQQQQQASAKDIVCCTGCIKGPLTSKHPKSAFKGRDFLMVLRGHNRAILG